MEFDEQQPAAPENPPLLPPQPPYQPPYAPPYQPPYPAFPPTGELPPYPTLPPPPAPSAKKRPRSFVAVAIATVAVLLAGVFAVASLSGGDGAASPEAAVERFMDALAHEDALGMLGAMAPAERDILRPTLTGLNEHLSRLGIINKVDLGAVPGIDIQVDGLKLDHRDVLPGISRVNILAGTIRIETRPDSVPIGDVLRQLIEAAGGDATIPSTSESTDLAESDDVFLVAIDTSDGWYLSLAFTIAEQARESSGAAVPDPAAAVADRGAPSPEAAVRQFLEDVTALDLAHIIGDLPPDEMAALRLYAPLFLEDAQSSIDDMLDDGFSMEIRDLQLESTEIDGGVRVGVKSFEASISLDGDQLDLDVDEDGCVTMSVTGPSVDAGDFPLDFSNGGKVCTGDVLDDIGNDALSKTFARIGQAMSSTQPGFVVVERDGRFYISPLRTVVDVSLQVLGAFERADLEEGGALYDLFTGNGFEEIEDFATSSDDASVPPGESPPATDDATLAALARGCQRGLGQSCDDLADAAAASGESALEAYGGSCGGRLNGSLTDDDLITCHDIMDG